ncbi:MULTISPECIES: hypothetical protein [unclassified Streptomyces]|uniref:hypothetical protein n=1 Tax=unclassified Streptomyces TaxID=2593676 RepID=UPI003D934EBD
MSEEASETPQWNLPSFTLLVSDALAEAVASYLTALEDRAPDIERTKVRMEAAHAAYAELKQARITAAGRPSACHEPHVWARSSLVLGVFMDEGKQVEVWFRPCRECGSVEVWTTNVVTMPDRKKVQGILR